MKRFRQLYIIVITALLTLTACQNDTAEKLDGGEKQVPEGYAKVRLRISPAGSQSGSNAKTRAGWRDGNAQDEEMMYIWTVIIVNEDYDVVEVQSCKPSKAYTVGTDDDREIDDITILPMGPYTFYSFANIGATNLESLLGLPSGTIPVPSSDDVIVSKTKAADNISAKLYPNDNSLPQAGGTSMERVKLSLGANGKVLTDLSADNAFGLGSKGIPMSNVQTKTITSDLTFDLIVIRMFAKMELRLFNETSNDITLQTVTLTEVTQNPTSEQNLMLLPTLTQHDSMDPTHKDIRATNPSTAVVDDFTYTVPTDKQTITGNKPVLAGVPGQTITFYVNESVAPTKNASGLFYLILGFENGSAVEYRHALISNTTDDEWSYIARNDYRVIPIVLTDWQFRIEPIAFAPIAGYPATTLSSDALTATFSTGGFIALQPYVKKRSDATWRDFGDPEVTFESITWKNSNGTKVSGEGEIIKTAFAYDDASKYIIGELNNGLSSGTYKTAVTVTVKLGPTNPLDGDQYTYSFTCDVVLDKP